MQAKLPLDHKNSGDLPSRTSGQKIITREVIGQTTLRGTEPGLPGGSAFSRTKTAPPVLIYNTGGEGNEVFCI